MKSLVLRNAALLDIIPIGTSFAVVILQDTGRGKSITNDAENVVKSVLAYVGPKARIQYFDTMGKMWRLTHDGSEFQEFVNGPWNQAELEAEAAKLEGRA